MAAADVRELGVGAGYALGRLERALNTATQHSDPAVRARAMQASGQDSAEEDEAGPGPGA